MANKASPFTGLDKALLRSTKDVPKEPPSPPRPQRATGETLIALSQRDRSAKPAPVPVTERANDRTTVRPNGKRIVTRNSFEIYEDQMDALREIAYREKREGKLGSMSAMVRAAIDKYIKEYTASGT